jgi:hypothetical protein
MPIIGRFGSLAGLGSLILPGGAMESIATVTVGSGGAASITFSDIPGAFQHLQIRMISRNTSADGTDVRMTLNGDTGANYAWHQLYGPGSGNAGASGSSSQARMVLSQSASTASTFGAHIFDILDYASTSKATTVRCLGGWDANGSGYILLRSGLWTSTNAVSTVALTLAAGSFTQHTTAALYGLRAP